MHRIELTPNSSLSPRATGVFFGSIATVCLGIALAFATQGYWPILPFAGLEVAGLGAALLVVQRRARSRETVWIDERTVSVRRCRGHVAEEHAFNRHWTRVELTVAGNATWPSRLFIASMGRRVEIGSFLTEPERRSLKARLTDLVRQP